jgi:hypothetical protein
MVTKKSVKKPTTKPAAAGAAAPGKVYKVKKQWEGGVREEFCKAIPAGGASLETIAKKAGVDVKKALAYARWLTAAGYLTRVDG